MIALILAKRARTEGRYRPSPPFSATYRRRLSPRTAGKAVHLGSGSTQAWLLALSGEVLPARVPRCLRLEAWAAWRRQARSPAKMGPLPQQVLLALALPGPKQPASSPPAWPRAPLAWLRLPACGQAPCVPQFFARLACALHSWLSCAPASWCSPFVPAYERLSYGHSPSGPLRRDGRS